ncbi:MAG: hypothetical protein Q4F95_00695 [Oscillospiraceae bacterium]|nr:hypothetical protein [Oscillospiraceae bacterium]
MNDPCELCRSEHQSCRSQCVQHIYFINEVIAHLEDLKENRKSFLSDLSTKQNEVIENDIAAIDAAISELKENIEVHHYEKEKI